VTQCDNAGNFTECTKVWIDLIDHETLKDYESWQPVRTCSLLDQLLEGFDTFAMKYP
jgi:hypothetical protein